MKRRVVKDGVHIVKSKAWYNTNRDAYGEICLKNERKVFTERMATLCGKTITVNETNRRVINDVWAPWMLEPQDKPLRDKQLVFAHNNDDQFARVMGFYDKVNNALYDAATGERGGVAYDNYESCDATYTWEAKARQLLK